MTYHKLSQHKGGMIAVGLGPQDAEPYLADITAGQVVVACINSPTSITISGDLEALDEVASLLSGDEVFYRKLKVPNGVSFTSYAGHGRRIYRSVTWHPDCRAKLERHLIFLTDDWTDYQIRQSLRTSTLDAQFNKSRSVYQCLREHVLRAKGSQVDIIVEIGAHGTLAGPIREMLKGRREDIQYFSCLTRRTDSVKTMQDLA